MNDTGARRGAWGRGDGACAPSCLPSYRHSRESGNLLHRPPAPDDMRPLRGRGAAFYGWRERYNALRWLMEATR